MIQDSPFNTVSYPYFIYPKTAFILVNNSWDIDLNKFLLIDSNFFILVFNNIYVISYIK